MEFSKLKSVKRKRVFFSTLLPSQKFPLSILLVSNYKLSILQSISIALLLLAHNLQLLLTLLPLDDDGSDWLFNLLAELDVLLAEVDCRRCWLLLLLGEKVLDDVKVAGLECLSYLLGGVLAVKLLPPFAKFLGGKGVLLAILRCHLPCLRASVGLTEPLRLLLLSKNLLGNSHFCLTPTLTLTLTLTYLLRLRRPLLGLGASALGFGLDHSVNGLNRFFAGSCHLHLTGKAEGVAGLKLLLNVGLASVSLVLGECAGVELLHILADLAEVGVDAVSCVVSVVIALGEVGLDTLGRVEVPEEFVAEVLSADDEGLALVVLSLGSAEGAVLGGAGHFGLVGLGGSCCCAGLGNDV